MKRILLVILVLCLFVGSAAAEEVQVHKSGDFWYTIQKDGTVCIAYYTGLDTSYLNVPGWLGGKAVTRIGKSAFANSYNLATVIIPNGVTAIEEYAFSNCSKLTSVTIPNSVKEIGANPFKRTPANIQVSANHPYLALEDGALFHKESKRLITYPQGNDASEYIIPQETMEVGADAFFNCDNLASVTIPEGVSLIGNRAFSGCSSLTSVAIPEGVTTIGESVFYNCSRLTAIIKKDSYGAKYCEENGIPCFSISTEGDEVCVTGYSGKDEKLVIPGEFNGKKVTAIGEKAFYKHSGLTSVTIPGSVSIIGDRAFGGCSALAFIVIPEGVTAIGEYAFEECDKLTSVSVPASVESIGEGAFAWCEKLSSVTLAEGVSSIGTGAFYWCDSLTSITLPNSVQELGDIPFAGTPVIIQVSPEHPYLAVTDGSLIHKPTQRLVCFPYGRSAIQYTIPKGVSVIGVGAFYRCENLTAVNIPEGVTTIATSAFGGCKDLKNVTIPASVTSISNIAFDECDDVTLMVEWGSYAAQYSKSKGIPFIIADATVGDYRCTFQTDGSASITGYIGNAGKVEIPSRINEYPVTSIGTSVFAGRKDLIFVTIPEGVTRIGAGAFADCDGLTTVSIPKSVTSIGASAFSACENLTNLNVPDSVTSIGENAFVGCDNLKMVVRWGSKMAEHCEKNGIPAVISGIRSGDYYYTLQLDGTAWLTHYIGEEKTADIPGTIDGNPVVSIGNAGMTSWAGNGVTSITIPETVQRIEGNPFSNTVVQVWVSPENPWFAAIDDVLFQKLSKRMVAYPRGSAAEEYAIPEGILEIGPSAFFNCGMLISVTIPDSVTTIGDKAFSYCDNLISVAIPDSVTTIGDKAFSRCDNLISVAIPGSVTSMGENVFEYCDNLLVMVERGSYAAEYCKENGVRYQYTDYKDWLLE